MNVYHLFAWVEASALSTWLRESPSMWSFPFVLILHTVGMGFLVGANVAVDLRVLGMAPRIPLSLLEKFFIVMKIAFFINAISGILLLIAYPTKALTNPIFYLKLFLIAFGLVEAALLRTKVLRAPNADVEMATTRGKVLAATSLAVWAGGVTAGRFLAYTYVHLLAGEL